MKKIILILTIIFSNSLNLFAQYAGSKENLFFNIGMRVNKFSYNAQHDTLRTKEHFASANYELGITYRLPKYSIAFEAKRSFSFLLSELFYKYSFIRSFKSSNYIGINYCFKNKPIEVGLFHVWTRDDLYSQLDTLMNQSLPFDSAFVYQGAIKIYRYPGIGAKLGYFFHPKWRIGVEALYYYRKPKYINNLSNVSISVSYFFHPKLKI
ncbi:MAG: hypothetical protein ACKVTZ_17240 [Bacteroidia bacterium]